MSLIPKYKRTTQTDGMFKPGTFKANGCHGWMLVNGGNTNVTIGGNHVLEPKEWLSSPEENPDVVDFSEFEISFDVASVPSTKVLDTGALPTSSKYIPGVDPIPTKGSKLIIYRSYITT